MIKALVFDLDGTVVSANSGMYSKAIAEAFAELQQKDIKLIAATGRSPYELKYTGMINGLPVDAVVCLNGQYCYTEEEDLYLNTFPAEIYAELMQQMEHCGFPCAVVLKDNMFINAVNSYVEKAQSDIRMPVPVLRPLSGFHKDEVLMLVAYVPERDEADFLKGLKSVAATRWNPYAMDIVPEGSGKCSGVELVLRHFGIEWDEVIAFGDGDNDYEMLKRAGKGIAMANSSQRLLNGEFEVTGSVDEDGVLTALQKYHVL